MSARKKATRQNKITRGDFFPLLISFEEATQFVNASETKLRQIFKSRGVKPYEGKSYRTLDVIRAIHSDESEIDQVIALNTEDYEQTERRLLFD